jgi:hypothetical protein
MEFAVRHMSLSDKAIDVVCCYLGPDACSGKPLDPPEGLTARQLSRRTQGKLLSIPDIDADDLVKQRAEKKAAKAAERARNRAEAKAAREAEAKALEMALNASKRSALELDSSESEEEVEEDDEMEEEEEEETDWVRGGGSDEEEEEEEEESGAAGEAESEDDDDAKSTDLDGYMLVKRLDALFPDRLDVNGTEMVVVAHRFQRFTTQGSVLATRFIPQEKKTQQNTVSFTDRRLRIVGGRPFSGAEDRKQLVREAARKLIDTAGFRADRVEELNNLFVQPTLEQNDPRLLPSILLMSHGVLELDLTTLQPARTKEAWKLEPKLITQNKKALIETRRASTLARVAEANENRSNAELACTNHINEISVCSCLKGATPDDWSGRGLSLKTLPESMLGEHNVLAVVADSIDAKNHFNLFFKVGDDIKVCISNKPIAAAIREHFECHLLKNTGFPSKKGKRFATYFKTNGPTLDDLVPMFKVAIGPRLKGGRDVGVTKMDGTVIYESVGDTESNADSHAATQQAIATGDDSSTASPPFAQSDLVPAKLARIPMLYDCIGGFSGVGRGQADLKPAHSPLVLRIHRWVMTVNPNGGKPCVLLDCEAVDIVGNRSTYGISPPYNHVQSGPPGMENADSRFLCRVTGDLTKPLPSSSPGSSSTQSEPPKAEFLRAGCYMAVRHRQAGAEKKVATEIQPHNKITLHISNNQRVYQNLRALVQGEPHTEPVWHPILAADDMDTKRNGVVHPVFVTTKSGTPVLPPGSLYSTDQLEICAFARPNVHKTLTTRFLKDHVGDFVVTSSRSIEVKPYSAMME